MTDQINSPVNTTVNTDDNVPKKNLGAIARANLELPPREVPPARDLTDLEKSLRKTSNGVEANLIGDMIAKDGGPTEFRVLKPGPDIQTGTNASTENTTSVNIQHNIDAFISKKTGVITQVNNELPAKEKAELRSLSDLSKALHKTQSAIEGQLLADLFIEAANAAIVPHLDQDREEASYKYYMEPIKAATKGLIIGLKYNEADISKANLKQIKEFTKLYENAPEPCVRDMSAKTNKPSPA